MPSVPIHLFNITLFTNLAAGVGQNISTAINTNDVISYSVQFVWNTGVAPIGNVYLEASNDGTNFTQIPQTILAVTAASGSHMINVEKPSYSWFRLTLDLSSGSLTVVSAVANGKSH